MKELCIFPTHLWSFQYLRHSINIIFFPVSIFYEQYGNYDYPPGQCVSELHMPNFHWGELVISFWGSLYFGQKRTAKNTSGKEVSKLSKTIRINQLAKCHWVSRNLIWKVVVLPYSFLFSLVLVQVIPVLSILRDYSVAPT